MNGIFNIYLSYRYIFGMLCIMLMLNTMCFSCSELSNISPDQCFKFTGQATVKSHLNCSKNQMKLDYWGHSPYDTINAQALFDTNVNKFYFNVNITLSPNNTGTSCTFGIALFTTFSESTFNGGLRPGIGSLGLEMTSKDPTYFSYFYSIFQNYDQQNYYYFYSDGYQRGYYAWMKEIDFYFYILDDPNFICQGLGYRRYYLPTAVIDISDYNYYAALQDFILLEYPYGDYQIYVLNSFYASYLPLLDTFSVGDSHCMKVNSTIDVIDLCCDFYFPTDSTFSNFTLLSPDPSLIDPWFIATIVIGPSLLILMLVIPIAYCLGKKKEYVSSYEFENT